MTLFDPQHSATAMIVAGVMSGTSADGVDVALVRLAPAATATDPPQIELIGHRTFPYATDVRDRVLAAMDAKNTSVAELSHLNWRLGQVYATCVTATCAELNVATPFNDPSEASSLRLDLISLHGQTIYHQGIAAQYAGAEVRATWQTGEAAVMRERVGVPVVSDFRSADLAAGGQGAPLVPMLDFCLFRSAVSGRVLLNLGGIANLTLLPAGARKEDVLAFDTGPASMVIDALMNKLYGHAYDENGNVGASGRLLSGVVDELIRAPYFALPPPKSCGREQFGSPYADRILQLCRDAHGHDADVIATATELTVRSIVQAFEKFCASRLTPDQAAVELIAAGGGARNSFLMTRLRKEFMVRRVRVLLADDFGIPAEAKEAVAFALLGWLSWHGQPGNIPSATGARRAVVLGRVTC